MSNAGRPSVRQKKAAAAVPRKSGAWLLWLELFGHGLIAIIIVGLLVDRLYGWSVLIVYLAIQCIVMAIDRFSTWHAWPFIVRDWRLKGFAR